MTGDRPPRPTRADFVHWSTATTRWADMDGFGHMNNARYFELIDTAIDLHLQDAIGGAVDTLDRSGCSPRSAAGSSRRSAIPPRSTSASSSTGLVAPRSSTGSGSSRATTTRRRPRDASSMVYVDNTDPARPAHRRCPTSYDGGRGLAAVTGTRDPRVDDYLAPLPDWQRETFARRPRGAAPRRPGDDRDHQAHGPALLRPRRQRRGVPGGQDHVNVFVYDGGIVPDPHGLITAGHENKTARTIGFREGDVVPEERAAGVLPPPGRRQPGRRLAEAEGPPRAAEPRRLTRPLGAAARVKACGSSWSPCS